MYMLDILTIVHNFADPQTASRIRRTCRRLGALTPQSILYRYPNHYSEYEYRVGDKKHRLDGPAVACLYGYTYWYRRGIAHREYHPQCSNKYYREYVVEDLLHREAGPSTMCEEGEEWYFRDKLHRKTGPANTILDVIWYTLGKRHRLDGPSYRGVYYIRGIRHRISSPVHTECTVNGVIIRI